MSVLKNKWVLAVLLVGLITRAIYISNSPYPLFAHEADQFVEYIDLIKKENRIPYMHECWVCYHPPLYMLIGAVIAGDATRSHVQVFSSFLSIVFMVLAAIYLHLLLKPQTKSEWSIFYLVLAFSVLWSSVIMNTLRIGNESLNYIWFLGFLILFQKWIESKNKVFLGTSIGMIILSYFTKSSWIIPFATLVSYLFLKEIKIRYLVLIGCLLIATEAGLQGMGKGFISRSFSERMVPNITGLPDYLKTENSIKTMFGFSPVAYTDTITDLPTRPDKKDYFWSFFLRTARIGEFRYEKYQTLHSAFGYFFFTFVLCALYAIIRYGGSRLPQLDLMFSIFALMAMRLTVPYACAQDMRYIQVSFISFAALLGFALIKAQKTKWLFSILNSHLVILIALSLTFILTLKG